MTACEKEQVDVRGATHAFVASLISGASAGTFVDTVLFPLDTVKTRLQSQYGFLKSGGFSGLYSGILPVLIGSAPTAALFFLTYEGMKITLTPRIPEDYHALLHMGAASLAEVSACLVRVPVEVIKQRKQAFLSQGNLELRFMYRGYWSTVLRDLPFSLIQFPLWEYFKKKWTDYVNRSTEPVESAICGSMAGLISAAVTTPLDVAKTRIMLAAQNTQNEDLKLFNVLRAIYQRNGLQGLFAGLGPRLVWISLGGFIFFGVYEQSKLITLHVLSTI